MEFLLKKILPLDTAASKVKSWQILGQTIVFTNGCFDLLHAGHIQNLYEAAQNGDRLVLGLNTDESIRELKGENRPINLEKHRAIVLAGLSFVDLVVGFGDPTPIELIKRFKPDVLVKGGDWEKSQIVGADHVESYGGTVKSIPFEFDLSSTQIIEKIKA